MQLGLDEHLQAGDRLLLLSAGYDGEKGAAYLKLLRRDTGRVEVRYDDSGHLPYCYTDLSPQEALEALKDLGDSIVEVGEEEKFDALRLKKVILTKIVVRDPLTVGGRKNSVRERIKTWESDIPYHLNYLYDKGLICGITYKDSQNGLTPETLSVEEARRLASQIKKLSESDLNEVASWITIMEAEQFEPPYCALDIEVYSPIATRLPDPSKAEDPVIAVSICGSDGRREVFMLRRGEFSLDTSGFDFKVSLYESEEKMLEDVFEALSNYAI
ncbi:MAG: 3'-5' exonuclease, partial [Nitrososphaerota archaeon]